MNDLTSQLAEAYAKQANEIKNLEYSLAAAKELVEDMLSRLNEEADNITMQTTVKDYRQRARTIFGEGK